MRGVGVEYVLLVTAGGLRRHVCVQRFRQIHRSAGFAVCADREIGIVAVVVALGILQSMLLAIGIEMGSRGLEVRGIALRVLMKVDGMYARRQILEIDLHSDSGAGFP